MDISFRKWPAPRKALPARAAAAAAACKIGSSSARSRTSPAPRTMPSSRTAPAYPCRRKPEIRAAAEAHLILSESRRRSPMRRRKKSSEIYKQEKRFRGLLETHRRVLAFRGARATADATGDRRRRAMAGVGAARRGRLGRSGRILLFAAYCVHQAIN